MASDASIWRLRTKLKSSLLTGFTGLLVITGVADVRHVAGQDNQGEVVPLLQPVPPPPDPDYQPESTGEPTFVSQPAFDDGSRPGFEEEPEFMPPIDLGLPQQEADEPVRERLIPLIPEPEFEARPRQITFPDSADVDPVQEELVFQEAMIAFDNQDYATVLQILGETPVSLPAARYYYGLCLLRTGRAAEAVPVLEDVRNDGQASDELRLDASIALLKSGQATAAAEELDEMLVADPDDSHARYFLGLALYEQGDRDAAREQIELAAQFDETLEPYRDAFRTYDQRLGAASLGGYQPLRYSETEPRRWNLSFLTGYEYDSNVPLSPEFSGLGGNIQREDSRWVVGLFGDYRFIQETDEVVGATASVYTNFHNSLTQFDVQTYSASAYWNRAIDDWIVGLNYNFAETVLGRDHFASNHRLTASATKRWEDCGHTTGFYEYEFLDLAGLSLIPAQNRSGHTNAVGLTQAWYFGPQNLGRVYAGYRFDNTDAYGSDFDMNSHMLSARVEYPIFEDLLFDAEARQFWDEYSSGNSLDFFERSREDQRIELRTGLQKYIDENISLRLDYTYVDSDSNVANLFGVQFYSYQRHVLSALLIYDF